jgi:GAF domain-containing protein
MSHLPWTLQNLVFVQAADPMLWIIDTAPLVLALFARAAGARQDGLLRLNRDLRAREDEIRAASAVLEQQVATRTSELSDVNQKLSARAGRLEAIAEISQAVSTIQDSAEALSALPEMISRRLGYYHVGIFLTDTDDQYVVLRASNSEGGHRMLAAGHRLKVGVTGLVGYAARSGSPRIALDVGADPAFFDNPNLSHTRSEVALPLKVGDKTIGVLDIQSIEAAAFGPEDTEILSVLANQVAVAIQNSRLLAETRASLQSRADLGARELERIAAVGEILGYEYSPERGVTAAPLLTSSTELVNDPSAGAVDPGISGTSTMDFPVRIRDQVIGVLRVEALDPDRRWSDHEIGLLQAISGRAATALENAGFLSESQRRVAKERAIGEISARIGASTRFESILETAARELSRALGGSDVRVEIDPQAQGWAAKVERP